MPSRKLARELINLIIDHLHSDEPTLQICALVCRDWVAPSRFHLFCHISLFWGRVDQFLLLCDSPFSTIPRAKTHTFSFFTHISQVGAPKEPEDQELENSPLLNRLLTWRSLDGQKTLAVVFSQLRTLALYCVGWWTLSASARETLVQLESLRKLDIGVVFETGDEFFTLLGMFPNLEVLSLHKCYSRRGEATANHGDPILDAAFPPRLHTISITRLDDESATIVDTLALRPCYSLRVFNFGVTRFSSVESACGTATAIEKLVASAGPSLEVFSAEITPEEGLYTSDDADLYACFELINLTKNTSLQHISLRIKENRRVLPFLQRLTETTISSKFFTPTLQFLEIEDLPALSINWETLDMLLQHPYFSALSELRYTVTAPLSNEDVIGHPLFSSVQPNWGSDSHKAMLKNIKDFGAQLPLCRARGILRPREIYEWHGGLILDTTGNAEDVTVWTA
ncbi:hypothetical protein BOTBODRAFT_28452 [Botryobasidium botryosum FD-172 SS1]|uniref:F-box domain-containing protein n=1 Tax=Botryobasidium botryosum (strain FD-172 SS1) TaxID=930990 RepID=A0A067MTP7_BOTB1|nr:hypothetical protein BOTBODRAFT_28452 [Botryobasidium botryosum FD-172 SS1]